MKVAILQSNYIPWKGYFDIINSVDFFVIYDEVQYTKNDWRNRNMIKTPEGTSWITIPAFQKNLSQKISETTVCLKDWNKKHLKTIEYTYAKASCFKEFKAFFEELYLNVPSDNLSEINIYFLKNICKILDIKTTFINSSDLDLIEGKTERLVDICQKLNATSYISGPAAKNYLDESLFHNSNIEVEWIDYSNYPVYPQLYGEFNHYVSIIDLILNTGKQANTFLKTSSTHAI
jgi:WbqC-like protein family